MIFTRDFVTRENHWQIASIVTKNRYSRWLMHYSLYLLRSKSQRRHRRNVLCYFRNKITKLATKALWNIPVVLCTTLRPRQHGAHVAEAICTCILPNVNAWNLVEISLNYISKGPYNNNPTLVRIMTWHRTGEELSFDPMVVWCYWRTYASRGGCLHFCCYQFWCE